MVTRYRRDNNLYSFFIFENDEKTGYKPYITIVKTPSNEKEPETIKNIPVRDCNGFTFKVNSKSISAFNGSLGLFQFIRECVCNDFQMGYVYMIVDAFIK